jgi:hypothetical protein
MNRSVPPFVEIVMAVTVNRFQIRNLGIHFFVMKSTVAAGVCAYFRTVQTRDASEKEAHALDTREKSNAHPLGRSVSDSFDHLGLVESDGH